MNETAINNTSVSNETSVTTDRPPTVRVVSIPTSPTSPLATNPWYRQKFELYRDVIEEKVRDEYPDLPHTYKVQPANIEHSTVKGYDLDFPIELHNGQTTIVSVAYSSGPRPAYTKEERRNLVTIRQPVTDNY